MLNKDGGEIMNLEKWKLGLYFFFNELDFLSSEKIQIQINTEAQSILTSFRHIVMILFINR